MKGPGSRVSREQTLMELMAALNSSLSLTEVLSESYKVLSRLLVADYAAICVSKPGQPTAYDWAVVQMPPAFFARYPELADEDFVRRAVVNQPNTVLRDSEMVSREELRRSSLYEHCRELKMPLEYVMAVLLDVGLDWHGGFTLYREGRRPFSDSERTLLQRLTPVLASTVRNCRMLSQVAERGEIMEALFHHEGIESVVLVPPMTEVMRTGQATELLRRWFTPVEYGRQGLPAVLLERLAQLAGTEGPIAFGQDTWERVGPDRSLKVTFVPLPVPGVRKPWALVLQEVMRAALIPLEWREKLTERELQVVERLLQGWDNLTLAGDLGCSVDTVKTHLKNIYVKLGIPSRTKLVSAVSEMNARDRWRRSSRVQ